MAEPKPTPDKSQQKDIEISLVLDQPRQELAKLLPEVPDETIAVMMTTAENAIARKEAEVLEKARKEVSEKLSNAPLDKIQKAKKALD
ncbi:MAG: hypothetical protein J7647_32230 [Cyanobacteria bacterium SBLK]|nr:hypothetical protein [Cyanobacteria bacterium SBLK]